MDALKQRLNAIKGDEDKWTEKCNELDEQIRSITAESDRIHIELISLQSREALITQELKKRKSKLESVLSKLNDNEASTNNTEDFTHNSESHLTQEEELTQQMIVLQKELHTVQVQKDEALLHLSHVEESRKVAEQKADRAERELKELDAQHTRVMTAHGNTVGGKVDDETMEQLELKVYSVQEELRSATASCEEAEREVSRLNRMIKERKAEISTQQIANDKLKKDIDAILNEMGSL